MNAFLSKPFTTAGLCAVIRQVLSAQAIARGAASSGHENFQESAAPSALVANTALTN